MTTILVIDDDEKIVETLSIILKEEGYDILTGSNGNECLKLCGEHKVDLVITDMVMPGKVLTLTLIDTFLLKTSDCTAMCTLTMQPLGRVSMSRCQC